MFPQDKGPVPQQRGLDLRPLSPPLPNLFPSQTQTLVLYDDGGPYGWLGELYGMAAGHLASHFGDWTAKPVGQYQAGDLAKYTAVIYVGSTYDQPVPVAFLDDALAATRPVIWIYDNIWQLANRSTNFVGTFGFNPWYFDTSSVAKVVYKGTNLTRYAANGGGIMLHSALDPAKATVLASAVRADGTTFPWAVRSGFLTYIGENPFAYISEQDRYVAFSDLLFDALAPSTQERHRALVRIEDVSGKFDPKDIRAIADYLSSEQVPFSIAVIPQYLDPLGAENNGIPQSIAMHEAPAMVDALKYAVSKGATLHMHGYTHQYSNVPNPYNGVSADDFEFWRAHVDPANYVILDGPIPEDSDTWAAGRIANGLAEWALCGFAPPTTWEYPHYAGSAGDSRTISTLFPTAYHRGLYFKGALTGQPDDPTKYLGQFFPYVVNDVYGFKVIPENIANYEPLPSNNNPPRPPEVIIANAKANLVVRDGFASFYFHPFYDIAMLKQIVAGIKQAGYTFVKPQDL